MSKTSFSNITRSAIWNAYNNICFYCGKALDWDDLQIDHIIPEHYQSKAVEFNNLKKDYGLAESFGINDLKNLVPTHSRCNLRKSGTTFTKQTILYYLEITSLKVEIISEEIIKIQKRRNKGQILSKLNLALDTNLISIDEVKKAIQQAEVNQWSTNQIKLPHGVEFIDEVYDAFYYGNDYSHLLDKNLMDGGLSLANDNGDELTISTLREWQKLTANGYYPKTNIDIKIASSNFVFLGELITALSKAKMPKASFVSDPWIALSDLDLLSSDIFYGAEENIKPSINSSKSIGDLVREGVIRISESDYYTINLESDYDRISLIEQFRADFNEDGIEDIFVRGWYQAVGGTMGYSFTFYLTRRSAKGLIESM